MACKRSFHRHNGLGHVAVPLQLLLVFLLLSLVAPSSSESLSTPKAQGDVVSSLRGMTIPATSEMSLSFRRLQETTKDKTTPEPAAATEPPKEGAAATGQTDNKPPTIIDKDKTDKPGDTTGSGAENIPPQTCESAKKCAQCEQISTTIQKTGKAYCLWNITLATCATVPFIAKEGQQQQQQFTNNCPAGGSEDDSGSFSGRLEGFAMLLAIFGVLLIVRQRIVHGRSGFHSSLDRAIDQVASSVASSTGGSRTSRGSRYQEVPVDDDDEWGWEDSKPRVGDVELSSWRTSSNSSATGASTAAEENVNHGSLGDSLAAPPMKNKLSPQPMKKRISSGDTGMMPASPSSGGPAAPPPMAISSLGKPISALSKKTDLPPQAPKKEDDIFASMGLAARPTFTSSAPPSGGGVTSPSMEFRRRASPPVVSNLNTAAASNNGWGRNSNTASMTTEDPQPGGEAWDDDADLDDLLND